MTDKMVSFLKHLNIENIDDFDIDFEMVGRNRFKPQQIDMMIVKKIHNHLYNYHLCLVDIHMLKILVPILDISFGLLQF